MSFSVVLDEVCDGLIVVVVPELRDWLSYVVAGVAWWHWR